MLFKEPRAAMAGASDPSEIFRTTKGSGGKDIGPYIEANEKHPGCRNLSILCLFELKLSVENTGLEIPPTNITKDCKQENLLQYIKQKKSCYLAMN